MLIFQGAEARVREAEFGGFPAVIKERFPKSYRHPDLNARLQRRIYREARTLQRVRRLGIDCPAVLFVDTERHELWLERITGLTLKDFLDLPDAQVRVVYGRVKEEMLGDGLASKIGQVLAKLHSDGIVHGDITSGNIFIRSRGSGAEWSIALLDFGLSTGSVSLEDFAVDLYVMERAFDSGHAWKPTNFVSDILESYSSHFEKKGAGVLQRLEAVRMRGRKRDMAG